MWKTSDEFTASISLPYGVKTSHTWYEVGQILRIINDYDIMSFIEVGTHVGGLSTAIASRQMWHPEFNYVGMELDASIIEPVVLQKCKLIIGDCLAPESMKLAQENMLGRTMIYCDNGHKIEEMKAYAPLLRSGDIIACHDFASKDVIVGLGVPYGDGCDIRPEVWPQSIEFLHNDLTFMYILNFYVEGTRIIGFMKK